MAITSQSDLAMQMIRQLRILDPSVSAEIGTPERKIIDTVAQALADAQIDLNALTQGLNLDAKFGEDLDAFLSLFNFARQKGTQAIGIVEFSRITTSNIDIVIPIGTQVAAPSADGTPSAIFGTTQTARLVAGELAVHVPVRSINVGTLHNVAAGQITLFTGSPVQGITGVTNPTPTRGGTDLETDANLKVRFKNTIFRNLAGTTDQYLALAVAGTFTNKANVVGPFSRYREYIQVPDSQDSSNGGNGDADEFTTALSTVPHSQYVYDLPVFVTNGQTGVQTVFYTQGVDFRLNIALQDKNKGDAYRQAQDDSGPDPLVDVDSFFQPSLTFQNVYTGGDGKVVAVRPGDVVLMEHVYLSSVSRNDYAKAVLNCVDVFINNANAIPAATVIPKPTIASAVFIDASSDRLHYDNYRRIGEPEHRPVIGNIFSPLYWTPIESVPDEIVVGEDTYTSGIDYWGVIDVGGRYGTVRARTGIEWSINSPGSDELKIIDHPATSVNVSGYTFDRNVIDLQSSLEAAKQVTTDVLVHKAMQRYFKFDVTVMYMPGVSTANVNQNISNTLRGLLDNIYFGSVIQLSDILQYIHNVPGVDNVRWSHDVNDLHNCVTETDAFGNPRSGIIVDRIRTGNLTTKERQQFYLTGDPDGGTYRISFGGINSSVINYNAGLGGVQTGLAPLSAILTAPTALNTGADGTPGHPFILEWENNAFVLKLVTATPTFVGGPTVFNTDFFLKDNELATIPEDTISGDAAPGLIIRPRAQSTWLRE